MPGTFSKSNRPPRPGTYVDFAAVADVIVPPAVGSVVAVPFTADWGPVETVVPLGSLAEYGTYFGPNRQTDGWYAVQQAFRGEGLPGVGGAGEVLAYRMVGSAGAKATRSLANSAATPVTGLAVSALYEGTRGNSLNLTIRTNSQDGTLKDLVVYVDSQQVESYTYSPTDLTDLADQINGISDYISVSVTVDGVALATVTNVSLTGGNSGTTLVSGDWTGMEDAFEVERFGIFAPYNLTDSSILASLLTWVQTLNDNGKRFMAVVGGALNETVTTAVSRSASLNDPAFVNVGVGSVSDSGLLDSDGNAVTLSSAQLAPRIAGILAARGESQSLTFARLAGLTILQGPTESSILTAFNGGVTVLSRDSNTVAPVRIEKGLTTFTDTSDADRPYLIFRTPKYVRTMDGIQTDVQEFSDATVIGQLPVDNKTRDFVLGYVQSILSAREGAGVVQSGWTVVVDPDPAPSDSDDFIGVLIGLRFGRSTEQVFFTINVG